MPEVRTGRALERRPATGATPAVRASRLAMLERRAARARRRLVLTLLLTLLTAAGWTVVGLGYATWWAGAGPTGLLAVVLVLGVVAARSARRADARWRAEQSAARREALQARALANGGPYAPRNRARVTGRAVRPSGHNTQMIPRVDVGARAPREPAPARTEKVAEPEPSGFDTLLEAEEPTPKVIEQPAPGATSSNGVGGPAWDPVPVPLPTYVTKPEAPRREPKPFTGAAPVAAPKPAAAVAQNATDAPTSDATADAPPVSAADAKALADELLLATEPPRQRTETLGLPLEQILARRRAAG
jgi:hypothetical protein